MSLQTMRSIAFSLAVMSTAQESLNCDGILLPRCSSQLVARSLVLLLLSPHLMLAEPLAGMTAFDSYLNLFLCFQYFILRGCLSAPTTSYLSTQNLTINELTLVPSLYSLNSLSPLNLTSSPPDLGVRYRVPDTYVLNSDPFVRVSKSKSPETRFGCKGALIGLEIAACR